MIRNPPSYIRTHCTLITYKYLSFTQGKALSNKNRKRPVSFDVRLELSVTEKVAPVGFKRLHDVREASVVQESDSSAADREIVQVAPFELYFFE